MKIDKSEKLVSLTMKLDYIISDRTQYKPYIAQLSGTGAESEQIYVQLEIPESDQVKITHDGKVRIQIISANGLAAILDNVAAAIEDMNDKHNKKKFNL